MHSADAQRLAETMSALAVNLAAEHNQQATLNAIVAAAVTTVPGAKWAGISLIAGRDITAATSTADIVADIDQMQRDLDEGPCVTAIREHHTVLSNDLATDSRWPRSQPRPPSVACRVCCRSGCSLMQPISVR